MSRKRNKMQELPVMPEYVICKPDEVDSAMKIVTAMMKTEVAKERTRNFTAKPCASCEADRPAGTNFSRVYATRGKVRYCRCSKCGYIWKDSDS